MISWVSNSSILQGTWLIYNVHFAKNLMFGNRVSAAHLSVWYEHKYFSRCFIVFICIQPVLFVQSLLHKSRKFAVENSVHRFSNRIGLMSTSRWLLSRTVSLRKYLHNCVNFQNIFYVTDYVFWRDYKIFNCYCTFYYSEIELFLLILNEYFHFKIFHPWL